MLTARYRWRRASSRRQKTAERPRVMAHPLDEIVMVHFASPCAWRREQRLRAHPEARASASCGGRGRTVGRGAKLQIPSPPLSLHPRVAHAVLAARRTAGGATEPNSSTGLRPLPSPRPQCAHQGREDPLLARVRGVGRRWAQCLVPSCNAYSACCRREIRGILHEQHASDADSAQR